MREVRGMGLVVALLALITLAGCSTLSAPAPTDPADPAAQAVAAGGDLGAIGCAILAGELSPEQLAQAQAASVAAMAVLRDPVPTISDLSAAFASADMDPRYSALTAVVVQRIKVRLGGADLLPTDSTAWAIAEAFVESCQASLVALPST